MEPDPSGSSHETGSSATRHDDVNFEFVLGDEQNATLIRRHAMRASWRERKRQGSKFFDRRGPRGVRVLAPIRSSEVTGERIGVTGDDAKQNSIAIRSELPDRTHASTSSLQDDKYDKQSSLTDGDRLQEGEVISLNVSRVFDVAPRNTRSRNEQWTQGNTHRSTGPSITIGSSILDAFSSSQFQLEPQDLELLHHYVDGFPELMFGIALDSAVPHVQSDMWIPLEFSNQASFHGVLAYASAHLGNLRGESEAPPLAIMHNIKSIQIINSWLNDTSMATSDAAIAAVLRQTTMENWWGNDKSIAIHRAGLNQMIEMRGGMLSLGSNWRLEKACYSVLLVKEPYWFNPEKHTSLFPPILFNPPASSAAHPSSHLRRLRISVHEFVKFFNAFQNLRAARPDANISDNGRYPFVEFAVTRLKSFARHPFPTDGQKLTSHMHIEETIRFVSTLYIAVTWRDYLLLPNTCGEDLEQLNSALEINQNTEGYRWTDSLEHIFDIVLSGTGMSITNPVRSSYVLQLMGVARLLDLSMWMLLKEILLDTLLGILPSDNRDVYLNEEELYQHLLSRN